MMHDRRLMRRERPPTRRRRFRTGRGKLVRRRDREGRPARRRVAWKGAANEDRLAFARNGIPHEQRLTERRRFRGLRTAHFEPLVPEREVAEHEPLMELVALQLQPDRHGCLQQKLACEPANTLRDELSFRILQLAELPLTDNRSECCLNLLLRAFGQELHICCCKGLVA